jgi:hypothetical protein
LVPTKFTTTTTTTTTTSNPTIYICRVTNRISLAQTFTLPGALVKPKLPAFH